MDDITREKEMEAQLIHSGRMTALGEMASGVAHELNQPLNGIATYIQLLQSRIEHGHPTPDKELAVVYSDLLHEVERMSGIIDHLRIFHRSGGLPSANSPVDLSEVFTNAMKIVRNQIGRYGIELKENFESGLPRVMADRSRLEQLFLNLVINARDALIELDTQADGNAGAQKTINVDCRKTSRDQADWVRIEIRDNGPGISRQNIEKIFDPFFTTKDPDKGTGLGLAICYQAVADIHGTIEVESEPGAGTVFQIWIPASNHTD
jgi:signal transduction histidine kinase